MDMERGKRKATAAAHQREKRLKAEDDVGESFEFLYTLYSYNK